MQITVFTSNQPRHIALIESLATLADRVFAVMECNTVFPGEVQDFFRKSDTMQRYFRHVMAAEQAVFGQVRFVPQHAHTLAMKMGDLNKLPLTAFGAALQSDVY